MQDLNDSADDMIVLVKGKIRKKTTTEIEDLFDRTWMQKKKLISWSNWKLEEMTKIFDLKERLQNFEKIRWGFELVLTPFSFNFQFRKCKTS